MDRGVMFYPVVNLLIKKKTREILVFYCPVSPMSEYKWSTAGRSYFTASTSGFDGDNFAQCRTYFAGEDPRFAKITTNSLSK